MATAIKPAYTPKILTPKMKRPVNGTLYLVESSTSNEFYFVQVYPDGYLRCQCSSYRYRGTCKHIDALKEHLLHEQIKQPFGSPRTTNVIAAASSQGTKHEPGAFALGADCERGRHGDCMRRHCPCACHQAAKPVLCSDDRCNGKPATHNVNGIPLCVGHAAEFRRKQAELCASLEQIPGVAAHESARREAALPAYATDNRAFSIFAPERDGEGKRSDPKYSAYTES